MPQAGIILYLRPLRPISFILAREVISQILFHLGKEVCTDYFSYIHIRPLARIRTNTKVIIPFVG